MKQRILSGGVILALLFTLLPVPARAAGHDHSSWTKLTEGATSLSGNVYLNTDVTAGTTITVTGSATLCLNGHVLDLNGNHIAAQGGSLTICDCQSSQTEGYLDGDGLWHHGTDSTGTGTSCPLTGGVITGGRADNGGAILVESGALTLESGNLAGSLAQNGGGVYVGGGSFDMSGGTITGNLANGVGGGVSGGDRCGGGGVYVGIGGTFTMDGGYIEQNTAEVSINNDGGGGVMVDGGSFHLWDGTIAGNAAVNRGEYSCGGGVYLSAGHFTMTDGTVSGNRADAGGGVMVFGNQSLGETVFQLSGGSITGNDANSYGGGVFVNPSNYLGEFRLSGRPDISNNTKAGSEPSNLYLSLTGVNANPIVLDGELTNTEPYGVDAASTDGLVTSGWNAYMAGETPSDYFTSEVEGSLILPVVESSSQEVLLHRHRYSYAADASAHTITESCSCGHEAKAVLTVDQGPHYANGSPITPAEVTYIGSWVGKAPELTYENNVEPGTATAVLTMNSAVLRVDFTISEPLPIYEVTFDANGYGTAPDPQYVQQGGKVTPPGDPSASGYTFGGWYKEPSCTTPWDFDQDTVSGAITLYAKWTLTPAVPPAVAVGEDVTQPYGTPNGQISVSVTQSSGHTYTYQWYSSTTDSSQGGTELPGATEYRYTIPADTSVGAHYYYCVVTAVRTDNGQTAQTTSDVVAVTIHKASQTPPAAGDGYIIHYQEETIEIDGNYEVYTAQTGGEPMESGGKITPGTTIYIRVPESATHAPSGWTEIVIPQRPSAPHGVTKADETIKGKGDGAVYGITEEMEYQLDGGAWRPGTGEPLTNLPAGTVVTVRYPAMEGSFASEETELVIQPSAVTLTVTFQANGGTDVERVTGLSYGAVIPAPTTSKAGYTLDGWYWGEQKWDFAAHTVTEDLTLEARWSLEYYTITYRLDGGSFAEGEDNPDRYTVETQAFSLHNPTKPGYTFVGWTEGEDATPQPEVTIPQGSTGSKTYTAHWTLNAPVVTLRADASSAGYGESITLTASLDQKVDGLNYTYAWYKDGSPTPVAGEDGAALTLTQVADSGSYRVEVTVKDAAQSQTALSDARSAAIQPMEIFVTWLGLSQVYGDGQGVCVIPCGVLDGDVVTATVNEAVSGNAGTYQLTAALSGPDAPNYILKNGEATLEIGKKPVVFTVSNNAAPADNITLPTISAPGLTQQDYTVAYKDADGGLENSPAQPGTYQVWVEITNPNYCHSDGSADKQVGTFTIAQAQPALYAVSFVGGEEASGSMDDLKLAGGSLLTLPACAFELSGSGFAGWLWDGKLYQPGDSLTLPSQDVTFTAQWQTELTLSGTVAEKTEGGTVTQAEDAVVSLWLGSHKIGEVTTGADGGFHFEHLVPGVYNLVVSQGNRTVTQKVELTTEDKTCSATLPEGATNSIVEVAPGSPDVVVGELDTVFKQTDGTVYTETDAQTVEAGGKVEITFTAQKMQQEDAAIAGDMNKIAAEKAEDVTLGLVMDFALEKTVTEANGTVGVPQPISQSNVLLEVLLPLPAQLQGKTGYYVYRVHGGQVQELGQGESNQNELEEYFTVSGDKTSLTLYVKCFSTYAVGYTESAGTPDYGNSGGGSSTSTYPPSIQQPEHGRVTLQPNSPQKGDSVVLTPTPEEGYTVDTVTVTDSKGQPVKVTPNGDGTYTFTQPSGTVTITVTFRPASGTSSCPRDDSCPMALFADADRSAWYHDGVHYCLEQGLMAGTGQTTFAPDMATTRGMIVTILWRLAGSPIVGGAMDYGDVTSEDWFGAAVRWADSAGVAAGYDNGMFGPDDPITREQMAVMLWRYAGSPQVDGSLASFADGAQTSAWAQQAIIWAVNQGLLTGADHGLLAPLGQATRAQTATMLMRFAETGVP